MKATNRVWPAVLAGCLLVCVDLHAAESEWSHLNPGDNRCPHAHATQCVVAMSSILISSDLAIYPVTASMIRITGNPPEAIPAAA